MCGQKTIRREDAFKSVQGKKKRRAQKNASGGGKQKLRETSAGNLKKEGHEKVPRRWKRGKKVFSELKKPFRGKITKGRWTSPGGMA